MNSGETMPAPRVSIFDMGELANQLGYEGDYFIIVLYAFLSSIATYCEVSRIVVIRVLFNGLKGLKLDHKSQVN